jgi:hypothetical protein
MGIGREHRAARLLYSTEAKITKREAILAIN